MNHEIIIGIIIFCIVIGQIWIFSITKSKIGLFKSIFPSNTFKTINVFIPEVEVAEISYADIWSNIKHYTVEPSKNEKLIFKIRIGGVEESYLYGEYENVIAKYKEMDFQMHFKKSSQTTFVDYLEIDKFKRSGWSISTEKYDYIKLTLVQNTDESNYVLLNILKSIDTYLLKNKGAISDFNLIKDIVERNCDAEDEQINTLLPIPLYLGLMGTMAGIIFGLFAIPSISSDTFEAAIPILIGGVKVAMIASLVGLGLTTLASGWFYKGAKSEVEGLKNEFFTFIQTELLPSISNSATNSIATLQTNLLKFNEGFTSNVDKFDNVLQDILGSFKNQISIVEELKEIDVAKLARFNIDVLKELRTSTVEFEKFNQYLGKVNEVVDNATQLNTTLKSDLDRIGDRKQAFEMAYVKVNDSFETGIKLLRESNDDRLKEVKRASIEQQDVFEKHLIESGKTLQTIVDEKSTSVAAHVKQNNDILVELQKQSELRLSVEKISGVLKEQNNTLAKFTSIVEELNKKVKELSGINSNRGGLSKRTKIMAYTFMGSCAAVSIGFIFTKLAAWGTDLYKYLF